MLTSKGIMYINSIDMVWLLNVKLGAEQVFFSHFKYLKTKEDNAKNDEEEKRLKQGWNFSNL